MTDLNGFQQCDFQQGLFRSGVAQSQLRFAQHLEHPGQPAGGDLLRLLGKHCGLGFGGLENRKVAPRKLENQQVPKVVEEVREQAGQVFALGSQSVELAQRSLGIPLQQGARQRMKMRRGRQSKHRKHVGFLDVVAAEADELIQGGLGIPHAALRTPGDGEQRRLGDRDVFLRGDCRKLAVARALQRLEGITDCPLHPQHFVGIGQDAGGKPTDLARRRHQS